jgi:hypothetical protein
MLYNEKGRKKERKKRLQKNKCIELMGNFPPDLIRDASKAMLK